MKVKALPTLLELIPVSVQAIAIAVLILLVRTETMDTLFAVILSLVWLKLSDDESVVDFGKIRANRELFRKIGEWLDRPDAAETFDEIQSKHLMFEHSIEHEDNLSVATSKGIANFIRNTISFALYVYLILVVAQVLLNVLRN